MWTFRTLRPMWEYRFFQQDFPDIFPPSNHFCNVVSPGDPFSRRYLYLPYQFPVSGLVHRFLIDCLLPMLPLPVPFSFARDFSTAAAVVSTGSKMPKRRRSRCSAFGYRAFCAFCRSSPAVVVCAGPARCKRKQHRKE